MKEDMKKVREYAQYEIEIQHSNCADAPKAAKARVRKAEEVKAAEEKVVISKHDRKMLKKVSLAVLTSLAEQRRTRQVPLRPQVQTNCEAAENWGRRVRRF